MQICEMRALRSLYSQRELLKLTKTRFISTPEVLYYTYTSNEHLSRCVNSSNRRSFHSSNRRFGSESNDRTWVRSGSKSSSDEVGPSSSGDENPNVVAVFDPVSGTLVTRTIDDEEISTKVEPTSGAGTRTVDDEEISTKVEPTSGAGTTVKRTWLSTVRGKESFIPNVVTSNDVVTSDKLVTRTADDEEIADEEDEEDEEDDEEVSTKVEPTSGVGTSVRRTWSNSFRGKESAPRKTEKSEVEKLGYRPETSSSSNEFVFKKRKGKRKTHWVCSECGESSSQWWGYCRQCQAANTLKAFSEMENDEDSRRRSWMQHKAEGLQPQRLTDVTKGINQLTWRIPLSGNFGAEVSRVLGGGLVPGSLVLVGGDPGVGKSTLVLQIAAMIAEGRDFDQPAPVVYVSGEESAEQIGNRADRMRIGTDELFLYSSTDVEDILEKIQVLSPRALVIDSIQTVYLKEVTGSAGGLQQVKECTSALLRFAKKTNVPVFLIGHVTKTGDIAGPRVLEHIVDVVLYMEGEKYSSHRFLRSVKNRFGSTDELGVFEMAESGLQTVSNPSQIFLSEQYFDSDVLVGLAVAVIIDGSRTFLIEIQALCVADDKDMLGSRQVNGVHRDRFQMIIAVLMKQAGLKLQNHAIFVNVVSGVKLKDTSGDLAIVAAICSSFLEFPIPNNVAFIGEVGLGGELRAVSNMEKRVIAVSKLGYKKCIVPKTTVKSLAALDLGVIMIIGCKNLKEVINNVFQAE